VAPGTSGGFIPGAQHIPAASSRCRPAKLPDKDAKLIVYCAGGVRSAFAAKTLRTSATPTWSPRTRATATGRTRATPSTSPFAFTDAQLDRYSRHLLLPEVGEKGQAKLLEARVLLLGAGGLGAPAALYLAAAGVGTIGIIDGDTWTPNLQRQVIHGMDRVGTPKVDSAAKTIANLNPDVKIIPFNGAAQQQNVDRIFDQKWDVIVDGLDNFPTRYLVNDASVWKNIPVVHGSIFRFDGQVTTFWPDKGPCYRCLYPEPPPAHLAPSCAEAGVLGVLPASSASSRPPKRSRSSSARASRSSAASCSTTRSI
jgi:molybdopterin/thiamine biosynthesis adenylyltransferase